MFMYFSYMFIIFSYFCYIFIQIPTFHKFQIFSHLFISFPYIFRPLPIFPDLFVHVPTFSYLCSCLSCLLSYLFLLFHNCSYLFLPFPTWSYLFSYLFLQVFLKFPYCFPTWFPAFANRAMHFLVFSIIFIHFLYFCHLFIFMFSYIFQPSPTCSCISLRARTMTTHTHTHTHTHAENVLLAQACTRSVFDQNDIFYISCYVDYKRSQLKVKKQSRCDGYDSCAWNAAIISSAETVAAATLTAPKPRAAANREPRGGGSPPRFNRARRPGRKINRRAFP